MMKNYIIAISLILFGFVACTDDIPERGDSPVMPENCQGVFFPTTNKTTVEMEPTEPTEITITIERVKSENAIEVPITVEVNDNSVFVVPAKVNFAAGVKSVQFNVTFPTAEEGVTYNLKLSVLGDDFVNQYATTTSYVAANVTRIKWEKTREPFIYIDGTFSAFFGVDFLPMYVETETATVGGTTIRYRFKNVYASLATDMDADGIFDGYPYNDPGDFDEDNDYYTVIEITPNKSVSMFPCEIGVDWGYGMFSIGSIYGNLSTNISTYPLGNLDGDVITFPESSLYISMADYNGGAARVCGNPTVIYRSKEAYLAANMKIKDFNEVEYEEIHGSVREFESKAYSDAWDQTIAKAIDIDAENPDSEYKNLYYLADLYAKDYGLAFYYNGSKISIPADQPIGKTAFQNELFVSQSDKFESSVTTTSKGMTVYTFGLKFHYKDGTVVGEFDEMFFYSESPITWSVEDFYGSYKLSGYDAFDEVPAPLQSVSISAGGNLNTLVIKGIKYAASVEATFDPVTSTMSIVPQELADYGPYDMTLYTITPDWDVSDTDALVFSRKLSGQLALTLGSDAMGYILYSDAAGGFVDGYYDLAFLPSTTQAPAMKSANDIQVLTGKKAPQKISFVKKEKCLNGNFAVQSKVSPKARIKMNATPIF